MLEYQAIFKLHTVNLRDKAKDYLLGLFGTERGNRNIERMNEKVGGNYQSQQHFITNSPWSAVDAMKIVAKKTNKLLGSVKEQGLMIDESSNKKSGMDSVGVSRQHNGNLGKIENSQTGVYAALAREEKVGLVNSRLFLPEVWAKDAARCKAAGVPKEAIVYKTKQQLAVDMIDELDQDGIQYGWIGADGFYGVSSEFRQELDKRNKKYILDIHRNQHFYFEKPVIEIKHKTNKEGEQRILYKTKIKAESIEKYQKELSETDYRKTYIRKGTKGWIVADVHAVTIWTWDKQSAEASEKTLIISKKKESNELKYAISNFLLKEKTISELALMHGQRHWIERAFRDEKNELGLAEYQIRQYKAWYHHQALVMMAMVFVLEKRIKLKNELPLLSTNDVRLNLIALLSKQGVTIDQEITNMTVRHNQRRNDINRYYPDNDYFESENGS